MPFPVTYFPALNPFEKVHIRKLGHLPHVAPLDHLLVVKQHPRLAVLELLADEGDVVPVLVSKLLLPKIVHNNDARGGKGERGQREQGRNDERHGKKRGQRERV